MSGLSQVDGGVRGRTRKAIIEAAMSVLADNPAAPLSDIAEAADVGRSTLHRYFPERADLIRALAVHVHALSSAAIKTADPTCGAPVDALRRVVESQLDLGPIVLFAYTEPTIVSDADLMAHLDTGDEAIIEVLDRVSTGDPNTPRGWARRVFWALLQAGYEAAREDRTPRHQIVDAIMVSLTRGTIQP
jgi:TetR/AcrR family transcriptional regulator, repressor for lfrA